MLDKVYGDHVHQNPGQHLSDGVPDDHKWQDYWRRLVVYPCQSYDVPKGPVGKRFIEMVSDSLEAILARKWNAEKFIVFSLVSQKTLERVFLGVWMLGRRVSSTCLFRILSER